MTKIFTIGDPHIQSRNIEDVDLFTNRVLPVIDEFAPDLIVVLGDVLHEHEKLNSISTS